MKNILEKIHLPHWLCLILSLVFILRIPSFFEPFSYGDEMIYLTLGNGVRQGVTLYKNLHDNKPPLLYILASLAGNVMWFRIILAFWSIVTIVLFWKLTRNIFPGKIKLQRVATLIFALLTTLPLLEGQIANAEVFMIGPIILALLILLSKKLTNSNLFIAGFLFGIATLFKIPAAFDMPVIIIYWLITSKLRKEELINIVKNSAVLVLGFIIPIAATFFWYFLHDGLKEYLIAAYLQNFGYLASWRPSDIQKPFLVKNGPLLIRTLIVLLGSLLLYIKRQKLSKQFIFVSIWLLFGLFAVTLSERPYPHYLIQIAASLSLLFSMLFTLESIEQTLVIIPLSLALIVPVYYKFWYYSSTAYYSRFLQFATGQISKYQYFDKFDKNVNTNYKIVDYLIRSSKPTDKIFVWGDSAPIYALSRRLPPIKYVANYHINDFYDPVNLIKDITSSRPVFIIVLPKETLPPGISAFVNSNYNLLDNIDGANIYHLILYEKTRLP